MSLAHPFVRSVRRASLGALTLATCSGCGQGAKTTSVDDSVANAATTGAPTTSATAGAGAVATDSSAGNASEANPSAGDNGGATATAGEATSTTGSATPSATTATEGSPTGDNLIPTDPAENTTGSEGGSSGSTATDADGGAAVSVEPEHPAHSSDHCVTGFEPDPTDALLSDELTLFTENNQTDVTVQPEVIDWLTANFWEEAHFQWHQVRRCGGAARPNKDKGLIDPCQFPELLPASNECEDAQDGYEFLVMHRHMMQSLRQLWPNHTEQFEGWDKFPSQEDYPEVLREYYTEWKDAVLQDAAIADDIANHLDMFANEGELGQWLQCGSLNGGLAQGSLHASLHFNGYPKDNQAHSVANARTNLDSYVFWKLHGWIDKVWENYRLANGQTPDEPKLQDELVAQCREMKVLSDLIATTTSPEQPVDVELPNEAGFFHEVVRPGLEAFGCATCHGEGEDAGLRLGYNVSSTEIVERLVNVDAAYAAGYKLVVPGEPDQSWLYLKAAGASLNSGVTCQGVMNCEEAMPPGMNGALPAEDLANLRQWIVDGAPMPTVL